MTKYYSAAKEKLKLKVKKTTKKANYFEINHISTVPN